MNYLWGNSAWWTRTGWMLGIGVGILGVTMAIHLGCHFGSCDLPGGLKRPGLAIELAYDWPAVLTIVGPCQARPCVESATGPILLSRYDRRPFCPDKVEALLDEQFLDRYFIVLYAGFFVFLGVLNIRFGAPLLGMLGGAATIALTLAAAYNDWIEDDRIVSALKNIEDAAKLTVPNMRHSAYLKWVFLFAAIGCASPLFAFWPERGRSWLTRILARVTAIVMLAGLVYGLFAYASGEDKRIETAAGSVFLAVPLATIVLLLAQYGHGKKSGAPI